MITNNEFDEMERIVDQVNDVSKTDREREKHTNRKPTIKMMRTYDSNSLI